MDEVILIIDDITENIQIVSGMLKKENYKVIASTNGRDGIEIAKLKQPDLILLDIQMPDMDGFEVCRALKDDEKTKRIPIMFMTARIDEESIEEAFKAGAADYVTKPIKKLEIWARIRTQIKLSQTILALEKASITDGLTGLYNHNRIFEVLDAEIIRAKRYGHMLSIMMLDIDFFKKVNDNFGHQTGDVVLKEVAREITKTIRNIDVAGRYGGEEFLVVLPETNKESAIIGAERLRTNIENLSFENGMKISISGGIVEYTNETTMEIIEKADKKLYKAKSNGRNRIEV